MARALERWLAPYLPDEGASATSATSGFSVERSVANVASVARATAPALDGWNDADNERAAIVEYDGGAPRAWAEGLARLDPAKPPGDLPQQRWLRFIDDCGRFLDGGWAARAAVFGWGPLAICSAAIGSGRSPASITLGCFGCSTAAP